MLAAAWGGDKAARLLTWLGVAALAVAAAFVPGRASTRGGTAFDGLFVADSFAAFAKIVIYVAAAVAMLMAMGWFSRDRDYRAEYPVLILLSAVGMGMMVSAARSAHPLCRARAAEPRRLCPRQLPAQRQALGRGGPQIFRPRRARHRHPALRHLPALRLHRLDPVRRDRRRARPDGVSTGELFGIVFVLAGIAFKVCAVPFHMWTPDVYEGAPTPVTAFFASAPKVAAMALLARVAVEAMGPATCEWRQIVIFMALASTILGGVAAIGQPNIKRLLAYSARSTMSASPWSASPPPRATGVASVLFYMAVYLGDDPGHLPRRAPDARRRGAAGREHRQPVRPVAAPGPGSRRRWRCSCSASPASRRCSASGRNSWSSTRRCEADLTWLAAVGIATSVISAFYYLRSSRRCISTIRRPPYAETTRAAVGAADRGSRPVRLAARLSAIKPLGQATINAARALF